jgi:hypothetical protein
LRENLPGIWLFFCDFPDKADAPTEQGFDQPLFEAVIADRAARSIDPACQRGFRDGAPLPNGRKQLVLAHYALAVLDQIHQKVEDLRLDRHELSRATQFATGRIERTHFRKVVEHLAVLSPQLPARL